MTKLQTSSPTLVVLESADASKDIQIYLNFQEEAFMQD
jgi:hypothetical protein